MALPVRTSNNEPKIPFSIGIVGGGRACEFFLDLLENRSFPYLDITISGVCDIRPDAPGIITAGKLGIPIFHDFHDLVKIQGLDAIIELTNNKSLPGLISIRPDRVGIIEHNVGRLLRNLFETTQDLLKTKECAVLDRGYYDILFQQTNLGVVIIDREFNIVDANEVYLKSVKKKKNQIAGKKCYNVVKGFYAPCPSEDPGFDCPLMKTIATGAPSHIIHEYVLPNGSTSYFSISAYPIRHMDNTIPHIVELWQDITSQITEKWENKVKKIHADMKKVIQEDRLVALGKLVASSVHEINNPIQGLLTFSHIISDMAQKESLTREEMKQLQEFNSHMKRELERCGNIVSGLLAFSRESALEFVNNDINEILKAVTALTGHKLKLSEIKLETRISPSSLVVYGDKNQLQQCFLNLIFNAIDAMSEGGTITIESGMDREKKTVWVRFSDNGCGIQEQNLEHVFDPFFTTKEEGGTGLGLSIVYGIVKDHRGNVSVNSAPGKGTFFVISFPAILPD